MYNRLKELRESLGLTQSEFAQQLGCAQQSVCMWERNERAIRGQTVSQICHRFNVREGWMRDGEGEMYESPATEIQKVRDFQRTFCMRVYDALRGDVQSLLTEIVFDEKKRRDKQVASSKDKDVENS